MWDAKVTCDSASCQEASRVTSQVDLFHPAAVPRKESVDRPTRERVEAHIRRQWRRYEQQKAANGEPVLRQGFASMLQIDPATLSRILHGTNDSLGMDVVLAVRRNIPDIDIDFEELLQVDPDKAFFEPIIEDGRKTRYASSSTSKPTASATKEERRATEQLATILKDVDRSKWEVFFRAAQDAARQSEKPAMKPKRSSG